MKRVWKLLTLLILCLTLSSGCTWFHQTIPDPKPEVIVLTEYIYTECPKSENPMYKALLTEGHIGSAYNLNALLDNLLIMNSYNDSLEATIKCYEGQSK